MCMRVCLSVCTPETDLRIPPSFNTYIRKTIRMQTREKERMRNAQTRIHAATTTTTANITDCKKAEYHSNKIVGRKREAGFFSFPLESDCFYYYYCCCCCAALVAGATSSYSSSSSSFSSSFPFI